MSFFSRSSDPEVEKAKRKFSEVVKENAYAKKKDIDLRQEIALNHYAEILMQAFGMTDEEREAKDELD